MIGLISGKWVLILTVRKPDMMLSWVEKYKIYYPPITLNSLSVKSIQSQKHLGLTLDSKLRFNKHIS